MDRLLGRLRRFRRIFILLAVIGPGLITTNAGNDAGAIATYSQAGAEFGFRMLWILVLITISLAVVNEMASRMGVVTGKGLADLIRERFGVRGTTFAMLLLLVANAGTTMAPWMLFYLQSSVAEKGIPNEQLAYSRADAVAGALFADLVAFFIIVAAAVALYGKLTPEQLANMQAADYARALTPVVGKG